MKKKKITRIYKSCKKIFFKYYFFILSTISGNSLNWNFKFFFKTSSAVASTLYQLALHPEEQDRAYNEVCNILPDKDMHLDGKHLDELKYLKACIKETLRFVLNFYSIFVLMIILSRNLIILLDRLNYYPRLN